MRFLAAIVLGLCLTGCQYLSPPALYSSWSPAEDFSAEPFFGELPRSAVFSVAIYNVEGLPWPARAGRRDDLGRIGASLAAWREAGRAPDVVMLQEVFSREAIGIARRAGYANALPGPHAWQERAIAGASPEEDFTAARRRLKGERLGKRVHAGLYILTDLPVLTWSSQPFSRQACAGFDCLANKGVMHARIRLPENGAVIDLFNAHLNSRGSSGVGDARADQAHRYQIMESAEYLLRTHDKFLPIIYGGDFNTARARARFDALTRQQDLMIAHRECEVRRRVCDVRISADGDEPWLDTQDLQLFENGHRWALIPLRVETLFDGGEQAKLSDHDGFMVTYQAVPAR